MRSGGVELATSAMVPAGPAYARTALPLMGMVSPSPLFGFGSKFIAARSSGVEAFGAVALAAALASDEKIQKALA